MKQGRIPTHKAKSPLRAVGRPAEAASPAWPALTPPDSGAADRSVGMGLSAAVFSEIDRHFAALLDRLAGGDRPDIALAAALVSGRRREGHICLDLKSVAGRRFPEAARGSEPTVLCPALGDWRAQLRAAPVVGQPGEFRPLILDGADRLYLHRYWHYQESLATAILQRASAVTAVDSGRLEAALDRLFPLVGGGTDWQRVAAETAARRQFSVISGGPGTGKTRTLARILALLIELHEGPPLRFALAAPTGKAAARIQEALRQAREQLPCTETVKALMPAEARTIHRLLEPLPDSTAFRRNAEHPLAADVVVIDEASMVDLALMAKLFAAVPPRTRLILLGDKDQLASVEAGAVLGDLCAGKSKDQSRPAELTSSVAAGTPAAAAAEGKSGAGPRAALAASIVELRRNFRFGEQSAIFRLSQQLNAGDADGALGELARARADGEEIRGAKLPAPGDLKAALREKLLAGWRPYFEATDPRAALEALGRFRILCAVREGPYGVQRVNALAEEILAEAGLIQPAGPAYLRRPLMVTRNDYGLRLFNGDIGAILSFTPGHAPGDEPGAPVRKEPGSSAAPQGPEGAAKEAVHACFLGADGEVRAFLPARLPEHETVFAMTIHKSQGSEFERLLLILPERDSPVLTRELLYTGLTRAREGAEIWFEEGIFRQAVARQVERTSGLRDALWQSKSEPTA